MNWNNYIMRKYGGSIRKKIAEAYLPFYRANKIIECREMLEAERINEIERRLYDGFPVVVVD